MNPILYFSALWVESRQLENPEENKPRKGGVGILSFPTFKFQNTVEAENNQGCYCQLPLLDRLARPAPSHSEKIDALIYLFIHVTNITEEFYVPGTIVGAGDTPAKEIKFPIP